MKLLSRRDVLLDAWPMLYHFLFCKILLWLAAKKSNNFLQNCRHSNTDIWGPHKVQVWNIKMFRTDQRIPFFSLEWLKLNNNQLRSLPYELVEPILDTVKHIDIHGKLFLQVQEWGFSQFAILRWKAHNSTFSIIRQVKLHRNIVFCWNPTL